MGGTQVPDTGRPAVDTWSMTTMTSHTGERLRLDRRVVDELGATFRGELVAPGDGGYETHRRGWNGSIDRHPALIARCAGVAGWRRRPPAALRPLRGGGGRDRPRPFAPPGRAGGGGPERRPQLPRPVG